MTKNQNNNTTKYPPAAVLREYLDRREMSKRKFAQLMQQCPGVTESSPRTTKFSSRMIMHYLQEGGPYEKRAPLEFYRQAIQVLQPTQKELVNLLNDIFTV